MKDFLELFEAQRPRLLNILKGKGLSKQLAEDLVQETWLDLYQNKTWFGEKLESQRVAYIVTRLNWKTLDHLKSKRNKNLSLNDEVEFQDKNWQDIISNLQSDDFKTILKNVMAYNGPAPMWSKAKNWYLPKRNELHLRSYLKILPSPARETAIRHASFILKNDLDRVVNNLRPTKSRQKLEMELGIRAVSDLPEIMPLLEKSLRDILMDFLIWQDSSEEFAYEGFFAPYRKRLEDLAAPHVERLGTDKKLNPRQFSQKLMAIQDYFKNLEGRMLAEGKALILKVVLGMTYKEVANEMFLEVKQVERLVKNARSKINALNLKPE